MTCIEMSKKYVDVYQNYEKSDVICTIGFGFNPDDDHINSIIRTIIEKGKTLVVFEINNGKTEQEKAKEISEKLKLPTCEKIKVIYIDSKTRQNSNNKLWTTLLCEC